MRRSRRTAAQSASPRLSFLLSCLFLNKHRLPQARREWRVRAPSLFHFKEHLKHGAALPRKKKKKKISREFIVSHSEGSDEKREGEEARMIELSFIPWCVPFIPAGLAESLRCYLCHRSQLPSAQRNMTGALNGLLVPVLREREAPCFWVGLRNWM